MLNIGTSQLLDLARWHFSQGRFRDADAAARSVLNAEPGNLLAGMVLGAVALEEHRYGDAAELFRAILRIEPQNAAAWNNLALALRYGGQMDAAIEASRHAVALAPGDASLQANLGDAWRAKGDVDAAIAAYRAALALRQDFPDTWFRLGNALVDARRQEEAVPCYRQAAAQRPGFSAAVANLGTVLKNLGKLDDAVASFREALQADPDSPAIRNNLAATLMDKGMMDEALALHRETAESPRASAGVAGSLPYAMRFHPGFDDRAIGEQARRWNARYAAPLAASASKPLRDRHTNRRLRIGYLSPDFRDHCQALFMTPLLKAHDHQAFDIFCYADVPFPDAVTRAQQPLADTWRDVSRLSDEQVAQQIRADGIDILVDLTMHMTGNRLLVFARRPAPVQVTWLAYPGTTGMDVIDYRLSDPYLDPPGCDESVYAEQTIRLPQTFWCYDPGDCRDLPVRELPALDSDYITFGCLNSFYKVNDGVLGLWSRVLGKVERSRLLLLARQGEHRDRVLRRLSDMGVTPDRVAFSDHLPRRQYMQAYHRVDIGLDTLPYNGHTTSLDSYFMGVPVVTRVGGTIVGRAGLSQLTNLGLPELIARSDEDFVRIAVALAQDLPRLKQLRVTLRERMERSPLMDASAFARRIEAAYRRMWSA